MTARWAVYGEEYGKSTGIPKKVVGVGGELIGEFPPKMRCGFESISIVPD
jgi:hypothetical protein